MTADTQPGRVNLNFYVQRFMRGDIPEIPFPLGKLMGIRLLEAGAGRAVVTYETRSEHANPMGSLHGGVLCDVADAAMGIAFSTTTGEHTFTTLELKINFLKPVWSGTLRGTANIVKRGRTIGLVECDIHDASGSLVARASSTCMVLDNEQGKGR
jgi:uncharacterized protein (TIGR00369 family)